MRERLSNFINSDLFHYGIMAVIILNALILGLQSSFKFHTTIEDMLSLAEMSLITFFCCEIALRIIVQKEKYFSSGWNIFDLIIITLSIFPHFRSLSVLRVFRVMRKIPHMSMILESMKSISGQVAIILLVILVLFYAFGVIGVRLYGELAPYSFSDLRWSFISLMQIMVGDQYGHILRSIIKEGSSGYLYFIVTTTIFTFIIINLFIGVVVGAIQRAVSKTLQKTEIEEESHLLEILQKLNKIEEQMKVNHDQQTD